MSTFGGFTNGNDDPGPVSLGLMFFTGVFIGAMIVLALVDHGICYALY